MGTVNECFEQLRKTREASEQIQGILQENLDKIDEVLEKYAEAVEKMRKK